MPTGNMRFLYTQRNSHFSFHAAGRTLSTVGDGALLVVMTAPAALSELFSSLTFIRNGGPITKSPHVTRKQKQCGFCTRLDGARVLPGCFILKHIGRSALVDSSRRSLAPTCSLEAPRDLFVFPRPVYSSSAWASSRFFFFCFLFAVVVLVLRLPRARLSWIAGPREPTVSLTSTCTVLRCSALRELREFSFVSGKIRTLQPQDSSGAE